MGCSRNWLISPLGQCCWASLPLGCLPMASILSWKRGIAVLARIEEARSNGMHRKRAFLVINPRAGQDMTRLADVIAVFWAAGWKTDNALVEYSGHSITLATRAAEEGYDLIIAHGGDGTINAVVNGVMKSKEQQSIVAVLPGGTANQWATEIGMPLDPVKAALTHIESSPRKVD